MNRSDAEGKVRRSTSPPPRDQHESGFTRILSDLVSRLPGARAAALVDLEGETVDYAGKLPPYEVKVAAAYWRIILDEIRVRPSLGGVAYVSLRASRASFQVHALPEGYALVVIFARAAGFGGWQRAVAACCNELGREAAWKAHVPVGQRWYAVQILSDARNRPIALGAGPGGGVGGDAGGAKRGALGAGGKAGGIDRGERENESRAVEILGAVASGMARRELGWRVRFAGGIEATLVREPGGHWYVDDQEAALGRCGPRGAGARGASSRRSPSK